MFIWIVSTLRYVLQQVLLLLKISHIAQHPGLIPWFWTKPKPPIVTLPPEILNEILKSLDVEALLSVRLTCKSLYSATKSRELWHGLVRTFQQRPGVSSTEESPLDYTVDELERWVLRRYRIQQAWSAPSIPTFRRRVIDAPTRRPVVLPGGRWLLSMDTHDRIVVTDLDASHPSPRVLCQVEERIEGTEYLDCPTDFVVWVNPDRPRLTCRVVMLSGDYISQVDPPERNALTRVHIFEAHLEGHGPDATLVAQPLRVVRGSFPGVSESEALDDRYFIQVKGFFRQPHVCKEACYVMNVFRYNRIEVSPITVETPKLRGVDIFILPHDRIVFATCNSISIYAIPSDAATPQLTLLHTIPVRLYSSQRHMVGNHTTPRIGRDISTVVYLAWNHLMAVYIPHDWSKEPHIVQLGVNKFPPVDHPRAVGFFNVIGVNAFEDKNSSFLDVMTCLWDVDSDIQSIKVDFSLRQFEFPDPGKTHEICGYDEGIGRIVMRNWNPFDSLLEVYDTLY